MTEAEQYHQWRYLEPEDRITTGNAKRWGLLETSPSRVLAPVCPPESEPKCHGRRWEENDDTIIDNE